MSPGEGRRRPRVAAITINWNGAVDTIELIDSMPFGDVRVSVDLYVVDNNSERQDLGLLDSFIATSGHQDRIRLIRSSTNIGVPAAYNLAIARAGTDYEYYLRLDNDVLLAPAGIRALIEGLEEWRGQGVGIVGGNVKLHPQRDRDNGGAISFDLLRGRNRITYPADSTLCDGVLGCIMLVDGHLVRSLAPHVFCPWLFFSTDESELSLRARARGVRTLYVKDTIGWHKGGRSTRKIGSRADMFSARNWSMITLRFAPAMAKPVIIVRLLITTVWLAATRRVANARAVLVGLKTWCASAIN